MAVFTGHETARAHGPYMGHTRYIGPLTAPDLQPAIATCCSTKNLAIGITTHSMGSNRAEKVM